MKTSDQKLGAGLVSGLALSAVLALSGCAKDLMDGPVMAKRDSHWDLRDDDRDGVINHRDQCSGTPTGSRVDVDGCTQWQGSVASGRGDFNVYFAHDVDQVGPKGMAELRRVRDFLRKNGNQGVELSGHASRVGAADYNKDLSRRRLQNVEKILIDMGVPKKQLLGTYHGFDQPAVPGNHAANRRVELHLKYIQQGPTKSAREFDIYKPGRQ